MQKKTSSENTVATTTEYQCCPATNSQGTSYPYFAYMNQSGINPQYYSNASYAAYYNYYQNYLNSANPPINPGTPVSNQTAYSGENFLNPRLQYQGYNQTNLNYGISYPSYTAQAYNCYSYWPSSYPASLPPQNTNPNPVIPPASDQIQYIQPPSLTSSYAHNPVFPNVSRASSVSQLPDIPLPETTVSDTSASTNPPAAKEVKFRIRPKKQSRFSSPVTHTTTDNQLLANEGLVSATKQISESAGTAQNVSRNVNTFSLFHVDEWPEDLKDYCTKVYQSCSSSPALIEKAYNYLIKEIEASYNHGNIYKVSWSEKPIPNFFAENPPSNHCTDVETRFIYKTHYQISCSTSGNSKHNEDNKTNEPRYTTTTTLLHPYSYPNEKNSWNKKMVIRENLDKDVHEQFCEIDKITNEKESDYSSSTDDDSFSKESDRPRRARKRYGKKSSVKIMNSGSKRKYERNTLECQGRAYERSVSSSRKKILNNRSGNRLNNKSIPNVSNRNKDCQRLSTKFERSTDDSAISDSSVSENKETTNSSIQLSIENKSVQPRPTSVAFKKQSRFRKNFRGRGRHQMSNRNTNACNDTEPTSSQVNNQCIVSNVTSMLSGSTPQSNEIKLDSKIVGTCTDLEKPFLRLTSEPEPGNIRPLTVLVHAFDYVSNKASAKNDLHYFCDQLKSIRQDLTVQNIRNLFTVRVYEANAIAALQSGDREEFNQCQTQLISLYKEGLDSDNKLQFMGYRLIYYMLINDLRNILVTVNEIITSDSKNTLSNYLDLRKSWSTGNFFRFFSCYKKLPSTAKLLANMFLERERKCALKVILKAYRPTISFSLLVDSLAYESDAECRTHLESLGIKIVITDEGAKFVDCKNSSNVILT